MVRLHVPDEQTAPKFVADRLEEVEEEAMEVGDPEEPEVRDIVLREYQKELANPAENHSNVLIVAPTGTGKTHVALAITKVSGSF